jgi:hypothetical protein
MAHAQKPDFFLRRNGRVHLNRRGHQFSRLLVAEMCASAHESSWNVIVHGDAREGKWRCTWRMEWVASTLRTTSERGVSSITTADAHTSAASSPLNWRPRRFKWTRPFRRKTKSGFCAYAITFQTQSNAGYTMFRGSVKGTVYLIHWPVSPSLPLPCVTVCHHISTGLLTYLVQHNPSSEAKWSLRYSTNSSFNKRDISPPCPQESTTGLPILTRLNTLTCPRICFL